MKRKLNWQNDDDDASKNRYNNEIILLLFKIQVIMLCHLFSFVFFFLSLVEYLMYPWKWWW